MPLAIKLPSFTYTIESGAVWDLRWSPELHKDIIDKITIKDCGSLYYAIMQLREYTTSQVLYDFYWEQMQYFNSLKNKILVNKYKRSCDVRNT